MRIPSLPGFSTEAFQKYFKNTGWLLLARVGTLGIKMMVSAILIPLYLGGEQTGALNYPLIFFFTGICTLGTDSLVTRQLLQHPEQENRIMGSAFRLRLYGGLVAIPLILLTYTLIAQYASHAPAASFNQVCIMTLICLVQSTQIIDSYFQSKAQGKYIMFVQVIANLLSAAIKAVLVWLDAGLTALIFMLVIDVALLQLGYIFFYKKNGSSILRWTFDPKIAVNLLRMGWPLAFSAIFISLYMRIGQTMLDAYQGNSSSGVYSTVLQYTESWYFVGVAICTSLFPAIMNFRKNQPDLYLKRMANLYDLMVGISVCIALGITLLAPHLFDFIYSTRPEFLIGASALAVNVWAGVFVFLGLASGQYLIAEGLTRITLLRTLIGAIAIILLNIYLIPRYGIMGVAYANVMAQFMSTFALLLFKPTRYQGLLLVRALLFISLFKFFYKILFKIIAKFR